MPHPASDIDRIGHEAAVAGATSGSTGSSNNAVVLSGTSKGPLLENDQRRELGHIFYVCRPRALFPSCPLRACRGADDPRSHPPTAKRARVSRMSNPSPRAQRPMRGCARRSFGLLSCAMRARVRQHPRPPEAPSTSPQQGNAFLPTHRARQRSSSPGKGAGIPRSSLRPIAPRRCPAAFGAPKELLSLSVFLA